MRIKSYQSEAFLFSAFIFKVFPLCFAFEHNLFKISLFTLVKKWIQYQ